MHYNDSAKKELEHIGLNMAHVVQANKVLVNFAVACANAVTFKLRIVFNFLFLNAILL